MSRITLTDRFTETVKCKDGQPQEDTFDALCAGLAIRVTKAGRKTWTYFFTVPGTKDRARLTLGTYPAQSLKDAREAAVVARASVEKGVDPRVAVARPAEKTIAQLIEERLKMQVQQQLDPKTGEVKRPALRTAAEIERRLRQNVIPIVGDVAVKDFKITHLNMVIDPIQARGAMRMAGHVFQDIKKLINFAIGRGELEYSPILRADIDKGWKTRERYLSLDEIKTVWPLLPVVFKRSVKVERILKLCLVSGRRLSEVAGMRRSEIDLSKRTWTLPAQRVKSTNEKARDYVAPLSDLAISVITEALRDTNSDYLFPADDGEGPYRQLVVDSIVRRAQEPRAGLPLGKFRIEKWNPHDLRRTVATQMQDSENGLEIDELIVSHVLNHRSVTKGNITRKVYNRYEYLNEKRDALDKWGAFLSKLVADVEIEQREAA